MIFQHMDDHMDETMMGWSSNIWLYMIIAIFLIYVMIAIILIFWLARGTSKDIKLATTKKKSMHSVVVERVKVMKSHFCANCGEKLDVKTMKNCPTCGSKI